MSFRAWFAEPIVTNTDVILPSVISLLNILTAISFILWALKYHRPSGLRYGIEKNRMIWNAVFLSFENNEFNEIVDEIMPNE